MDIVPLLTQFIHAPLGEKRALSLLQNLLSLDETARKKKRSAKVDKKLLKGAVCAIVRAPRARQLLERWPGALW